MQTHLFKACADSLRKFAEDKHNVKLKAAHAHELVAAYFGYKSKNAMLADTKYPVENMGQAEIVVMTIDSFIDERREKLKDLPSELPDSYTLGEWVYDPLFAGEHWGSEYPPFRGFDKAARYLVENNAAYQSTFSLSQGVSKEHIVEVGKAADSILLAVTHCHRASTKELISHGKTTIKLPRIAGHIGFGKPKFTVVSLSGEFQERIKLVEVES